MAEKNTKGKGSAQERGAKVFPASVIRVLDEYTVVINRGSEHGIASDSRFLVYGTSTEELFDPETGKSLGFLEVVRGTGRASHVQENVATIRTDRSYPPRRTVTKRTHRGIVAISVGSEEIETIDSRGELIPFDNVRVSDKARPV